jgi:glycosyltransferase involved in cell wall biosynthesis
VIIPTYKTAQYIAETLDSVLAQTFTDFEIIVVNDGSPDTPELEQVLQPYVSRIHYIVQSNRGLSGARNTAMRVARGEYVAFLDSDDVWETNYLAVQVDMMRRDPTITVLYPNAITFGDPQRAGRLFMDMHPSTGPVTFERLVTQQCNVMVAVLARREAVVAAGLFDESLRSSEDFDLWLRIIRRGGRIAYHRQPLVRSRLRPGSLSADAIWMCRHIVRVLDKVRAEMSLTPAEADLVGNRRAHFEAIRRLNEGRQAFFRGDDETAIQALTEANAVLSRRKIAFALLAVRLAPDLLRHVYTLRDRLVFRTSTR